MRKLLLILAFLISFTAVSSAQKPNEKSAEVVRVDGREFYLHMVASGETLYSLSRLYGVPIERIEFDNPQLKDGGLKAGQTIKVLCEDVPEQKMSARKIARTFDEHTVTAGETTYSIARRYSVSVNVLVQDNPGLDPASLKPGEKLKIRKTEIGETSPKEILSEMDSYAVTLSTVSEGYVYHVVEMGETVYGLSRRYGVTPESIMASNSLADGLKAGAMIKIPVSGKALAEAGGSEEPLQSVDPFSTAKTPYDPGYVPDATTSAPQFNLPEEYRYIQPDYSYNGNMNVAMLLPMSGANISPSARNNFLEFYQGALIALEDFKSKGFNITLDLYDTQRSVERVSQIVGASSFRTTDLIVGPVYEEEIQPVMELAYEHRIPVVSPLATMNNGYGSLLYQMAPDPGSRYEKLRDIFTPDKNIVVITADSTDLEFERNVMSLIGNVPYQKAVYSKGHVTKGFVESILDAHTKEAVFVVVAGNELGVDNILATISSVLNNRLARSKRTAPVRVIGNTRWMRYTDLDRNLLFKLNVSFVTSYHADRSDMAVRDFDRRYIKAFNGLPSLYAYRGYDAVKLFVGAMTGDRFTGFMQRLDSMGTPLQTNYEFRLNAVGNNSNDQWALVNYRNDYTITVE